MKKYRTSEVFVPGGMPVYTYVARSEKKLEEQLQSAKDNLCKLVTITGSTKSGKTVLTNRIFPRKESIWVDGGMIREENDLWNYILGTISGFTSSTITEGKSSQVDVGGTAGAEGGIPLVIKAKGELTSNFSSGNTTTQLKGLTLSPPAAAISQLQNVKRPVIIDDFHYLKRDFQGNIVRALKPLIFSGLPVVLIAIPHRRYDAVKVEREITGRLESLTVPVWEENELIQIPQTGFPLLGVNVDEKINQRMAQEAYGSPHLMQEFCRSLMASHNINETMNYPFRITSIADSLFIDVAESTGKVIYDKLAKGPRQRVDRIQRKLKKGGTADIYKVTLLGLANLKPGLQTVDYESLRASIRDVLSDNFPQANEVTRVLEKMAEIAATDESSTPVLDWEKDEQNLHITDPFFAFFLKWGVN
jgi:hypothetical protein